MISQFTLENFGPIKAATGQDLSQINLMIGANSSGKTFLLKALYSIMRSHEETGRGDDKRDFADILSDRFYWTFQTDKLGDIVTKGSGNRLRASITEQDSASVAVAFGQDTKTKITPSHNDLNPRTANSVFLPPKEVLSLASVIKTTTLVNKTFGYDATDTDLVLALESLPSCSPDALTFKTPRKHLEKLFAGKVEFDHTKNSWIYKKGNSHFSISATAEGIKKMAILETLLGNGFLSADSIIFIDEPESALHPTAITRLLDIIKMLADEGVQFFIASHSYYVVKKLLLIANQNQQKIPVIMAKGDGTWSQSCLLEDGLPENEIINESIRLFEQEFEGV